MTEKYISNGSYHNIVETIELKLLNCTIVVTYVSSRK